MYTLNFLTFPGFLAIISLSLVVFQLIGSIVLGGFDLDGDASGADFDFSSIVSPKGILHFLFGASWYLVLVQPLRSNMDWLWYDWVISIIIGLVASLIVIAIYYWLSKLACEKKEEVGEELVGRMCNVYLNNYNGNYDCTVISSETLKHIQVTSKSKNLDLTVGTPVKIISFENGIYFIQ
jgi:hypothetical protein